MRWEEKKSKPSDSGAMSAFPTSRIIDTLGDLGIRVSESFAKRAQEYMSLLLRWNRKVSLTSIREPEQILARHFGESLFGALTAGIEAGDLLDVGSGAGFPALPIAMHFAEIREILLEPNVKKAAFLSEVCRALNLAERVKVLRARLETYSEGEANFDFVTSRAVRVTPAFLERCRHFLRPEGKLVLWLGQEDMELVRKDPNWIWSEAAKIPGSERRFVVWGRVAESAVSRETLKPTRFT